MHEFANILKHTKMPDGHTKRFLEKELDDTEQMSFSFNGQTLKVGGPDNKDAMRLKDCGLLDNSSIECIISKPDDVDMMPTVVKEKPSREYEKVRPNEG